MENQLYVKGHFRQVRLQSILHQIEQLQRLEAKVTKLANTRVMVRVLANFDERNKTNLAYKYSDPALLHMLIEQYGTGQEFTVAVLFNVLMDIHAAKIALLQGWFALKQENVEGQPVASGEASHE